MPSRTITAQRYGAVTLSAKRPFGKTRSRGHARGRLPAPGTTAGVHDVEGELGLPRGRHRAPGRVALPLLAAAGARGGDLHGEALHRRRRAPRRRTLAGPARPERV